MASSCLGDRKQDARFDRHLTAVKRESFYWLTKTVAHNKRLSEKVKTKCKCALLKKVQNFVKTKSSVSVQKRKTSTILQSQLESKAASTPDHQCVGALPSLME